MKFCKDCYYCEDPTDPKSKCTHMRSRVFVSSEYTDVVTGATLGENVYDHCRCVDIRNLDICGYDASLFVSPDQMSSESMPEKSNSIRDRILSFFGK